MSQAPNKLNGELSAIKPHLALDADAAAAAAGCTASADAIDRLEAAGFLAEATRVVAHALPKREAVWWACMCSAHTEPGDLPDEDRKCREAAEDWVRQQAEPQRRKAFELAQAANFRTPEAWAAVAAFWSGGSMAPEGAPDVPPAAHLTGTAVAGAIGLAAARGDAARRDARLRRFLESGRNIAAGGPGRLPAET